MAIDIGELAIDRDYTTAPAHTNVNEGNPANATGTIDTVKIWANVNLENCVVGTFYKTNGNTLKVRDSAVIGTVTAGSEQTFTVDSGSNPLAIAVETGDFIGIYCTAGRVEQDIEVYVGIWDFVGECIDPDDEEVFTHFADRAISLYGTGEEEVVAVGRSFGFIIG